MIQRRRALALVGMAGQLIVGLGTGLGCAGNRSATRETPSAPVDTTTSEQIGLADVLEVRVFGEPELSGQFRVTEDGTIDYPFAGRLAVLGRRVGDIQQDITARLKDGYLKNPQVSVMVTEWNSRKISVLGQVQKPGSVAYFPRMTIVDAIAAAGGFTGIAAKNSVTLRREVEGRVDRNTHRVADISEGKAPNVVLKPGDVLVVEERMF